MDLSQLSPSADAREGRWFVYIDPRTEKPLENRDPDSGVVLSRVELKIATADTDAYNIELQNALRKTVNQNIGGKRHRNLLPKAEEEMEAKIHALARHVLVGFKGIEDKGEPLDDTRIENRVLVLRSPFIREFVEDTAWDAAQFLEEELGN